VNHQNIGRGFDKVKAYEHKKIDGLNQNPSTKKYHYQKNR